jgi:hypothetical protein
MEITLKQSLIMKSNFHLLFYLRKQKNYKKGPKAIYMRITVGGKRADMSAGRECEPTKWNSRARRDIGTKDEIKSLNISWSAFKPKSGMHTRC